MSSEMASKPSCKNIRLTGDKSEATILLESCCEDIGPTDPEQLDESDAASELESSDEDSGASDPEGFDDSDATFVLDSDEDNGASDSSDEEEYKKKRDPSDGTQSASVPPAQLPPTHQPATLFWKTDKDQDTAPPAFRFTPARTPGPQLGFTSTYTPIELFKLFFPVQTAQIVSKNTNKNAAKNVSLGKKYKWTDINSDEFYKYTGLILYMSLVKLSTVADYWRKDHMFSLPLPSRIMTRDRYRTISWNLHLSDPDEDVHNERKKGTDEYDKLFLLKPLMDSLRNACKAVYHPHRQLAVDERMVASKAKTGMTQYMKAKPTKWGVKLFVLADSKNGYTVDFSIYTGKTRVPSGHGLSYDVVMSLVRPAYLGSGYNIYMDNFYSSPKLFKDLHELRFGACGTYREKRKDCPRTNRNALTKTSARGSIRWIREGPIVFVKWMDTREVSVCSTIHKAHSGETVLRRVKKSDGSWKKIPIPCPTAITHYNKYMGGVDQSDQLIQYYSAQHKTLRWYRKLFYHFLDIATTNSYILHKEIHQAQKKQPMSHRGFMEVLTAELCGVPILTTPTKASSGHVPVPFIDIHTLPLGTKCSTSRRRCELCLSQGLRKDTAWKCRECGVALCMQLDRNCFAAWHDISEHMVG